MLETAVRIHSAREGVRASHARDEDLGAGALFGASLDMLVNLCSSRS